MKASYFLILFNYYNIAEDSKCLPFLQTLFGTDDSVSKITGFRNDYFGIDEAFDPWDDYLFGDDDLAYIKYAAFELKQLIKDALDSENLAHDVKQRISLLIEKIDENDNPILVIGKLKK